MKRSYLLTALVLALAAFTPACDGDKPAGGAEGQPAAAGDDSSSGDPVKDLQAMADGIQKDVDALMQPINDADAAIDAVSNLPKDIKATAKAKAKIDAKFEKKLLAEAKKIVDGQEPDIESLGLEAEVKVKVSGAFDKLKAG